MSIPTIGQKNEQIPFAINVTVASNGAILLTITQGIMFMQAPLAVENARQVRDGLTMAIEQVEEIRRAATVVNGR